MNTVPGRSFLSRVLIGRATQVETLRRLLTSGEEARTLIVSGEAGIGKSRLVLEARGLAGSLGATVLQGTCFERDSALPYSAVTDLLRGSLLEMPPMLVESVLEHFGAEIVKLVPELAAGHSTISPSPALDSEQERRRLFHALSQAFIHLSRQTKLLIVIEDLHWADETTLDFIVYCCRQISLGAAQARLHFLVTYRPEDAQALLLNALAELDRLRLAEEIRLDQLTRAETEVMARAILELHRPLRRDFQEELFRLTDGNPLLIEEVLKSLHTTGNLQTGDEADRAELGTLVVPRTVNAAVARRASHLSSESRRLLEAAAVTGQRFDLSLLSAVLGTAPGVLVEQIKELVAAQLVVEEAAGRFRFRHALTREAVYSGLLSTERAAYHARLADVIESASESQHGDLNTRIVDLAHHFYMAANWPKAQSYCERAGRSAQDRFAPAACVEHMSHAIEAARRQDASQPSSMLRVRASAYETVGEFSKALADLETAHASARSAGDQGEEWEALVALGMLWLSRDYDRAGAFFQQALSLAQEAGDRRRVAYSLNRVGNWQMNIGDPSGALARHHEALAVFEEANDKYGLADTFDLLGMTSYHCVKLADQMSYHRRAVELFCELGNRQGAASSLALLALSSSSYDWPAPPSDRTELLASIAAGEQAVADSVAIDWRSGESFARYTLGMTLGCQGDYSRALPLAREALRIAIEIEHEQWHVAAIKGLGEIYLDLLNPSRARALLEEGLEIAKRTKSDFWIASISASLVRSLVALGEPEKAAELLPTNDDTAPLMLIGWHFALARVEIAQALKDYEGVLKLTDAMQQSVWPDGRPSRLSLRRAEALIALRRTEDAAAEVGHLLESELLPRTVLWRAQILRGRIESSLGRRAEAARAYHAARQTIYELAAAIDDKELRETFHSCASALLPHTRPETEARARMRERFAGLTERECEVASLVAQGHSNRGIAEALFLSERTVAVHVANVLTKLGFASRTQIAAWATANGLVDADSSRTSPSKN